MRFTLIAMITLVSHALWAQDFAKYGMDTLYTPMGLRVGSPAPLFEGATWAGSRFSLSNTLENKQVILIFYRGNWCPYCNRYLSNLSDSFAFLLEKNVDIVVVSPENKEEMEKMDNKVKAGFTFLADSAGRIMQSYDVLFTVTEAYNKKIKRFLFTDIGAHNEQAQAQLPVPATYVISQDGRIAFRHFNYDYAQRASVKQLLDALK
jgi:peroxiredoxin